MTTMQAVRICRRSGSDMHWRRCSARAGTRHGRLMQQLGSPDVSGYLSLSVDIAHKGEGQVWQVYNLTGDTHPMHLHLANVQIVKREAWASGVDGKPVFPLRPVPGTARAPDPNEAGWKELRLEYWSNRAGLGSKPELVFATHFVVAK